MELQIERQPWKVKDNYDATVCGSMKNKDAMMAFAFELTVEYGWLVGAPPLDKPGVDSVELSRLHWAKIKKSDRVIVVNPDGRIGASTLTEIAVALHHHRPVYTTHPVGKESVGLSELKAWNLPIWGQ